MKYRFLVLLICILFLMTGCATWYKRTEKFNLAIQGADFDKAHKELQKDKNQNKGKNKILYYLNLGYVEFMLGNHKESNAAFETAEILMEEQKINVALKAATLLSNPEITPYEPEDFEVIMVNFYKAMNYFQMNDMEGALVEVRKINIKLNQLNDKYPDHKNRYQRDAFAHLIMGLIYDAVSDFNNAFIAYRNAYETYESDYKDNFGFSAPEQLKEDLMRTAYLCGFTSELSTYERTFNKKYVHQNLAENGNMIFFWLNGLGPIKSEWGLSFVKQKGAGGAIVFHNEEFGLTFPFFFDSGYSQNERNSIADLNILRVVFPKYTERPLVFTQGELSLNKKSYSLELAEDINQIAEKTLHDRMIREFSSSLLRLAAKQGVKYAASQQNEWLGFAVGLANSLTEKADTRNWQTLPHSFYYSRVPLEKGENKIDFTLKSPRGQKSTKTFTVNGESKKTEFFIYSTL